MEEKNIEEVKEYSANDMKKAIRESIIITSLCFLIVSLIIFCIVLLTGIGIKDKDLSIDLKKYLEVIDIYERDYIKDIDLTKSVDYSIAAFVASVGDKYGSYVPVRESAITGSELLTGNYYGLGITFAVYDTYCEIVDIIKDSPAGRSNLKVGDKIIKINGENVTPIIYDDFRSKISAKTIDKVVFTLDDLTEIAIELGDVKTPKVEYEIIDGVAYINIYTFVDDTIGLFKSAIDAISKESNVTEIIFDLRNNLGGDVDAVISVLDYILEEGLLLTVDSANEDKEDISYYSDSSTALTNDYKIKILVNRKTASAAELFTSVLRYYMDAVVIGETTYGKGTVVTWYTFYDGSILMLTSGVYTMPDGSNIEGVGINPDIYLNEDELSLSHKELYKQGLLEKD